MSKLVIEQRANELVSLQRKKKSLGANKLFISKPDIPISFSLWSFNTELSFFESSLAGGVEG